VHALLCFPPGVRVHPVLNDAGLVAHIINNNNLIIYKNICITI
jgi:hypothetical protein